MLVMFLSVNICFVLSKAVLTSVCWKFSIEFVQNFKPSFSSIRLLYSLFLYHSIFFNKLCQKYVSVSEKLSQWEALEVATVAKLWQLWTFHVGICDKVHVFAGIHTFCRCLWHIPVSRHWLSSQWLNIVCNVFCDTFKHCLTEHWLNPKHCQFSNCLCNRPN